MVTTVTTTSMTSDDSDVELADPDARVDVGAGPNLDPDDAELMLQGISLAVDGVLLELYEVSYATITVRDSVFTDVSVLDGPSFLMNLKTLKGSAVFVIDTEFLRTNALAADTQLVVVDQAATVQVSSLGRHGRRSAEPRHSCS
jgi:hypothetical protein